MVNSTQVQNGKCAELIFVNEATLEEIRCQVEENASTIVGRDASCGIVLEDQQVSGRHCMFRVSDGKLFVSDWHSEHGTIVNDQPITQETELGPSDQVSVGAFDVKWSLGGTPTEARAHQSTFNQDDADQRPAENLSDWLQPDSTGTLQPGPSNTDDVGLRRMQSTIDRIQQDNDELREELENVLAQESSSCAPSFDQPRELEQQEVELLRAEVAQLQSELAEREQEISELAASGLDGDSQPMDFELNDTEQLVERLEQLLDELQDSDRRMASMEELLRASDEAQQAETEERMQIENWLSEIESRIGRREEEWQSQNEQLLRRIEQLDSDRRKTQQQLNQALKSNGNQISRQVEEQLSGLQNENDSLKQQWEHLQTEHQTAQNKLDEYESLDDGESSIELRQRLRQQELEMVQERAAISRQKAELTKMRDDVEKEADSVAGKAAGGGTDLRFRALRDHLREIHDEEQVQKQNKGGLASRLSRLWTRLDSR